MKKTLMSVALGVAVLSVATMSYAQGIVKKTMCPTGEYAAGISWTIEYPQLITTAVTPICQATAGNQAK